MSTYTAERMIKEVRSMSGAFDTSRVFDGYPASEANYRQGPRILDILNRKIRELCKTGYNKCYFTLSLEQGKSEYLIPRNAGRIHLMQVKDSAGTFHPITFVTMEELEIKYSGQWRNNTASRPYAWYQIGTRAIGVWPTPLADYVAATSGYQLRFLADAMFSDMALPTDVPAGIYNGSTPVVSTIDGDQESALPEVHQLTPCYGAAAEVANFLNDRNAMAVNMKAWEDGVKALTAEAQNRYDKSTKLLHIRTGRESRRYRDWPI